VLFTQTDNPPRRSGSKLFSASEFRDPSQGWCIQGATVVELELHSVKTEKDDHTYAEQLQQRFNAAAMGNFISI